MCRRWVAAPAITALPAASAAPAQQAPSASAEAAPLTAINLHWATVPGGDFFVGLPEGWRFLPARRGDDEVQAGAR